MKEDNEEFYSFNDNIVAVKLFLKYLFKNKISVLVIILLFAALGFVGYYIIRKPKYEAVCTFILEEKQNGIGGLSGLASQFGLDVGSGGGSLFAGDNILEILKSRNIIQQALLSRVDSTSNKKLIDLYIEFKGWKNKWTENKKLHNINFFSVSAKTSSLSLQQDSVLAVVHKSLKETSLAIERLVKKGSLIKVSVTSENEVFAKLMVERIIDDAKSMYVQIKTNNSSANVLRLEKKADSLLRLLNARSYQTAGSIVIDANPAVRTVAVPAEINQRDKIVLQTLYGEVVKNLELSRITLMQQTPVIEILDAPTYPLIDKSKKLPFFLFASILAGILAALGFFLLKFKLKSTAG